MHIPDGYLSPQTYVPAYAAMVPLWAVALRKIEKTLHASQTPMLALGAAFSFVIMMFNVPIPGGTTGHAVGSVLIAILLGPWAAMVAVSLALILQALLFGDGGVTAIGANCLSMAVIMPFVGWGAYRLIVGSSPADSGRHRVGAVVGGYVGLNAAALSTAVMFGIQPLIAHDAAGRALYNPFGLSVAVPAMMAGHLLVFGFVEGAVTGLVIAYLQRTQPALIPASIRPGMIPGRIDASASARPIRKLAIGLAVLVVLSPLGLYLPAKFGAGSAWGEWSAGEMRTLAGHMPRQLQRIGSTWHAPLHHYAPRGRASNGLGLMSVYYIISAVVGVAAITGVALLSRRLLKGKERQ